MKKIGLICVAVLLCGSLSACSSQAGSSKLSKLRAEHSSLVKKYKHSNKKSHSKKSKNDSVKEEKKENKNSSTYSSKANKVSEDQDRPSNNHNHDQASNKPSSTTSNSDSAYYASLQKANDDYWKNLSPQEKQQWSQWGDAESRANDPYQNGYYNNQSSTAQSPEASH